MTHDKGQGIQRGNLFAKFILFHISLPIIGNLFSSLENKFILKNVKFMEDFLIIQNFLTIILIC